MINHDIEYQSPAEIKVIGTSREDGRGSIVKASFLPEQNLPDLTTPRKKVHQEIYLFAV